MAESEEEKLSQGPRWWTPIRVLKAYRLKCASTHLKMEKRVEMNEMKYLISYRMLTLR